MNDRCGITLVVDQGRAIGIYIKCFKIAVIQPNAFAVRAVARFTKLSWDISYLMINTNLRSDL